MQLGSDGVRRITEIFMEREMQALEFQRTIDKLFSFGGFRGESEDNPVHLARRFREMAGFTQDEITELVDVAAAAHAAPLARSEAAATASGA